MLSGEGKGVNKYGNLLLAAVCGMGWIKLT